MLKEVFAPHLYGNVKFGRRMPKPRVPRMRLGTYFTGVLPTPPPACNYVPKAHAALQQIYLNDQLGDCVIAGGYHVEGVATGNATGTPFIATAAELIKDYGAIGGYDPKDPNTDQGCDEHLALQYWTSHGFANGTKLLGWLDLDATNQQQVQVAMWLFENLFFGVALPDGWVDPFPSADGFTWDVGVPDFNNGHCFVGVGYDTKGVIINTWGLEGILTWAAVKKQCLQQNGGELHVMLTPDMLAKGQSKCPNGVDWSAIVTDFDLLGGKIPIPTPAPSPTPVPPTPVPNPAPAKALTLAQAQTVLAAGWPK
jgi:hypothetical protein